jgi:TIR domain/Polyketide cyclase / dehydrase and lipid transport
MSNEALMTASVVIDAPLLEVFDYVSNATHLPEWIPFYSGIDIREAADQKRVRSGDRFTATLSMLPPAFTRFASTLGLPSGIVMPVIEVCVDDVIQGRRISYRAEDVGQTTICDFRSTAGSTLLTVTHSLWSVPGLVASYLMGPLQAVSSDVLHRILASLKRRLEGRATQVEPRIFFSYRRNQSYIGGRIFDALVSEFGSGTVFRDSTSLLAGRDWQTDINEAICGSKVVVVHIGDDWERQLAENRPVDGLRDELETALKSKNSICFIPALTVRDKNETVSQRMKSIEEALTKLDRASVIRKKFTSKLQAQLLREDPDFKSDLENMMRSVWSAFREEAPQHQVPAGE